MTFNISQWRKLYDKVNELGNTLHDARPTYTENGSYIAPVSVLPREQQRSLESEINRLLKVSNSYLDQCGMKLGKPIWYYDRRDRRTWRSSDSFKYHEISEV